MAITRTLSTLLCLAMLTSSVPAFASSTQDTEPKTGSVSIITEINGDGVCSVYKDGEFTIEKYSVGSPLAQVTVSPAPTTENGDTDSATAEPEATITPSPTPNPVDVQLKSAFFESGFFKLFKEYIDSYLESYLAAYFSEKDCEASEEAPVQEGVEVDED